MTLQQKIGQLLIVGFDGTSVNESIERMITQYHIGNIILFKRNYKSSEQLFHLTQALQHIAIKSNGVPLLIALDQENGMVARIDEGVTVFPGSMAQSAGATLEEIKEVAHCTGSGLSVLGINLNLAPSVDVNNNHNNPMISGRSFGSTAEQVAACTRAYIRGLQETGVSATAKHFPGHGDTRIDSYSWLPIAEYGGEGSHEVALYPFKVAIEEGVHAIMAAHIKFPTYEPNNLPSTLSYAILTELLRERLGFKGVVITDCMEVSALETYYGLRKAVPMAIQAGADLVCLAHTESKQIEAIEALEKAVARGELTEARIDQSIERLLQLKESYEIDAFLNLTYEDARTALYQEADEALAERISDKSITLVKGGEMLPIQAKKILVIAPDNRGMAAENGKKEIDNFTEVFKSMSTRYEVTGMSVDYAPTEEQIEQAIEAAAQHECVVLCTYNAVMSPNQLELAGCIKRVNKEIILIPMCNPYDSEALHTLPCCLLPYEYTERSMRSLVRVLEGEVAAVGKLPITLRFK